MTDKNNQLIFLATDTTQNLSEIKSSSFRTIASYTAAFAYLFSEEHKVSLELSWFFLTSGIFVIWLCAYFYPVKLWRRRERLQRVYEHFDESVRTAHGSVKDIKSFDSGDWFYSALVSIYIVGLMAIFISSSIPLQQNITERLNCIHAGCYK